jgi:hypothetical protein
MSGQPARYPIRGLRPFDAARCQRVVTDYFVCCAGDKYGRHVSSLIYKSKSLEPIIEIRLPTREIIDIIVGSQPTGSREIAHS